MERAIKLIEKIGSAIEYMPYTSCSVADLTSSRSTIATLASPNFPIGDQQILGVLHDIEKELIQMNIKLDGFTITPVNHETCIQHKYRRMGGAGVHYAQLYWYTACAGINESLDAILAIILAKSLVEPVHFVAGSKDHQENYVLQISTKNPQELLKQLKTSLICFPQEDNPYKSAAITFDLGHGTAISIQIDQA